MTRKVPKDHKEVKVSRTIDLTGPLSEAVKKVQEVVDEAAEHGWIDPVVSRREWWDSTYEYDEFEIRYFRPMTERELATQKRRRAKAREAAAARKAKKEAAERAELERLKAKYEN